MPALRDLSAQLLSLDPAGASDASLDTGLSGVALAHAYLDKALGDARHRRAAEACIARAVELITEEEEVRASLFNGVAGVAWATEHLVGMGIVDASGEDPNEPVDEVLIELVASAPRDGPFDLMQGLVGIGVYALERLPRGGTRARALLGGVIERLADQATIEAEGVTWRSPPWREGAPAFDLGLAHGAPGVIGLLAAARAAGVSDPSHAALITGAVGWLRAQALPPGEAALFPHARGGRAGRDGFCYGDSGVARALFSAGAAYDRDAWRELAVAAADKAASRPGDDVEEAGLCHGAAGIAWMFERLAARSGERRHAAAAARWWAVVESDRLPIVGDGFLRGAAGVALALAARSGPAGWDRLLLGIP